MNSEHVSIRAQRALPLRWIAALSLPLLVASIVACAGESPTTPAPPASVAWKSVSAGGNHTCALDDAGVAFCWGQNAEYELGRADRLSSTIDRVATTEKFTELVTGDAYTCGLAQSGGAFCWGRGLKTTSLPSTTHRGTPTAVKDDPGFRVLTPGDGHACGIARDGKAYCWGDNFRGQLGIGLVGGAQYLLREAPTPLAGASAFTVFAPGSETTCGLSGGRRFCWGAYGGNGSTVPMPLAAEGPLLDTLVMGGNSFRVHGCGLTASGDVFCWGWNADGQAGAPPSDMAPFAEVALPGGLSATMITAGGFHAVGGDQGNVGHSCAIATTGDAYCWGNNTYGQLGDGTRSSRSSAVAVSGSIRFRRIEAGGYHTCGISTAGDLYCWGQNGAGQLGNGPSGAGAISAVPVRVDRAGLP